MSKNRFTVADLHLGHEKTCTVFKRADGSPLRPFANADEMDAEIIRRWNAKVGPSDRVYVLGDVVINRRFLPKVGALNGRLKLVIGNHDIFGAREYLKYFDDVVGYQVVVDEFIMSHVPIHPDSLGKRFKTNVHGHLHAQRVMMIDPHRRAKQVIDPRYYCVSVEHTDYAPISFEELKEQIAQQQL